MSDNHEPIARYHEGELNVTQINEAIAEAWSDIRNDPTARSTIIDRLGLEAEFFDSEKPPFAAETNASGFDGGAVAIFIAKAVASGVLAKIGGEGYEVLKKLWQNYFKRKVSPPGSNNVGDQVED